jgi:hypothetical protein
MYMTCSETAVPTLVGGIFQLTDLAEILFCDQPSFYREAIIPEVNPVIHLLALLLTKDKS